MWTVSFKNHFPQKLFNVFGRFIYWFGTKYIIFWENNWIFAIKVSKRMTKIAFLVTILLFFRQIIKTDFDSEKYTVYTPV